MNDQIHSEGSGHEHGELGDAEYAEFMELAAQEGFDPEEVEGALDEATARSPCSPSSAAPMSASRRW